MAGHKQHSIFETLPDEDLALLLYLAKRRRRVLINFYAVSFGENIPFEKRKKLQQINHIVNVIQKQIFILHPNLKPVIPEVV